MPDPRFQLIMPDFSFGYRPPKSFTDFRLKLDPKFESSTETSPYYAFEKWYIRRWSIPGLVPFDLNHQSGLDSALAPYLSQFSILATNNPNLPMSTILAQATSRASLDTDLFDKIRDVISDLAQDKLWRDIAVPGTKYANREQASIGKIDPSGKPQYDELSKIVPGFSIPPSILPVKYTTKRFPFVNSADVIPSIYLDTDVLLSNQGRGSALIAGGSIKIDGKTSDGLPCSLLLVGGRDQVGGPAFSLTLQIGPDYASFMANSPLR